jgi:hypothetical protein
LKDGTGQSFGLGKGRREAVTTKVKVPSISTSYIKAKELDDPTVGIASVVQYCMSSASGTVCRWRRTYREGGAQERRKEHSCIRARFDDDHELQISVSPCEHFAI